jgi:hypothetical protein
MRNNTDVASVNLMPRINLGIMIAQQYIDKLLQTVPGFVTLILPHISIRLDRVAQISKVTFAHDILVNGSITVHAGSDLNDTALEIITLPFIVIHQHSGGIYI